MKNSVAVVPDKEYIYAIDHTLAALRKMHEIGAFEKSCHEVRVVNCLNHIRAEFNCDGSDVEESVVSEISVREFVMEMFVIRIMMQNLLINKLRDRNYNPYHLEIVIEEIPRAIISIVGQNVTVEGYLALRMEQKKAAERLLKRAKPDDALKMIRVAENLDDLRKIVSKLKRAKIKPNIDNIVCPVAIHTPEDLEWFDDMAYECYHYLNSALNASEPWWPALS